MTNQPENWCEQAQRAIQRRVHEASPVQEIRIFGRGEALANPWLLACVAGWLSDAKHLVPQTCACCNRQWSPKPGSKPGYFVAVVPYGIPHSEHYLMRGLCDPCAAHPERQERIDASLRTMWPELRRLNHPVQPPECAQ